LRCARSSAPPTIPLSLLAGADNGPVDWRAGSVLHNSVVQLHRPTLSPPDCALPAARTSHANTTLNNLTRSGSIRPATAVVPAPSASTTRSLAAVVAPLRSPATARNAPPSASSSPLQTNP